VGWDPWYVGANNFKYFQDGHRRVYGLECSVLQLKCQIVLQIYPVIIGTKNSYLAFGGLRHLWHQVKTLDESLYILVVCCIGKLFNLFIVVNIPTACNETCILSLLLNLQASLPPFVFLHPFLDSLVYHFIINVVKLPRLWGVNRRVLFQFMNLSHHFLPMGLLTYPRLRIVGVGILLKTLLILIRLICRLVLVNVLSKFSVLFGVSCREMSQSRFV